VLRSDTPRVGGGRSNAGRYPSRKMVNTIRFESHRVELPIFDLEYDDEALEYYDQPPSIKLDYLVHATVHALHNGRRMQRSMS
jgi:putative transposase